MTKTAATTTTAATNYVVFEVATDGGYDRCHGVFDTEDAAWDHAVAVGCRNYCECYVEEVQA